ncbi:hypothetical protein BJ912DRAFT_931085 [Pholiota molesta]|nr:hypothetical protein BJ912DRAFT_931085 [Pholiota molesta]
MRLADTALVTPATSSRAARNYDDGPDPRDVRNPRRCAAAPAYDDHGPACCPAVPVHRRACDVTRPRRRAAASAHYDHGPAPCPNTHFVIDPRIRVIRGKKSLRVQDLGIPAGAPVLSLIDQWFQCGHQWLPLVDQWFQWFQWSPVVDQWFQWFQWFDQWF